MCTRGVLIVAALANAWARAVSQTDGMEGRLQELDEERIRLESEVDSLTTTTAKLEAELKSVYRRWDEESSRWAIERRGLQDQVKAQADATAALVVRSGERTAAAATPASSRASQQEYDALLAERDLILKNWSEETEILVRWWVSRSVQHCLCRRRCCCCCCVWLH